MANLQTTIVSGNLTVTGSSAFGVRPTVAGTPILLSGEGGGAGSSPGGSDGQVQYNNGGSFGGASSLYFDDINNRVGIGTSSPTEKLVVSGNILCISTSGVYVNSDQLSSVLQNQIFN